MKKSAGILLFKSELQQTYVLLVHPGGPFWKNKDDGSWSIPKGEFTDEENPLDAALREFKEETGISLNGDFIELSPVKLKSGKTVFAWACEHDLDVTTIVSNGFEIEWPPKSGRMQRFPEIDKANWFAPNDAMIKINPAQIAFLKELMSILATA